MAVREIRFPCGGTALNKKAIKFKIDDETNIASDFTIYEGPCDPETDEFFEKDLKVTKVHNEEEIKGHIPGIRTKLKEQYKIDNPIFRYP